MRMKIRYLATLALAAFVMVSCHKKDEEKLYMEASLPVLI